LGFGERSSRWFLFTILLTGKHRRIEKVVKSIHKSLSKKNRKVSELHAYHMNALTKRRLLSDLAEVDDMKILCIILNKKKVYIDLQNQKNYLYNYTANLLLDRLHSKEVLPAGESVKLFIDQKDTNKFIKENFENYLKSKLSNWSNSIDIKIKPSHTEKCLQAVDFASWAIFRKYELNDYEFYDIIKDKIIEERLLFP